MLELLGWEVSKTEAKCKPLAKQCDSLGVRVDLQKSEDDIVVLRNKDGRVEGIIEAVDEVLEAGQMDFKQALSINGKLQFAEGQLYYRVTAVA